MHTGSDVNILHGQCDSRSGIPLISVACRTVVAVPSRQVFLTGWRSCLCQWWKSTVPCPNIAELESGSKWTVFFLFLEEFQRLSMLQRDLSHQYFEIFRIFWVQFHSFWYTFIDFNYFPSKGINVKAKPVETELKPNRNPSSKPNCFARCFTDQVTPSRFAWSHSCRGTT